MSIPIILGCICCLFSVSVGELELVLIHTNDVHARIEQTNKYSGACSEKDAAEDKCYGGMARMWTKIQELRAQYPDNSLLLDAGDQFQGSLWSTYYKGRESAYFMNYMNYDIMTLGNHDFDYGVETVKRFIDNLTFPVVVCNLDPGETVLKGAYIPSKTFTIEGRKIGIIGYILSKLSEVQPPSNMIGVSVADEIEAVRNEAIKLKSEGVDIIIALGHSGYEVDKQLAREVDLVDIVIGAHTHTFLYTGENPSNEQPEGDYPTVIEQENGGKALVIQEFAYSKYLGFFKVNFTDDGKVSSWEGQPILLDSNIPEDPAMNETVIEWEAPLRPIIEKLMGKTLIFLEGDFTDSGRPCRTRECSLGNLVTDAVLWSYAKDRESSDTQWSDVAIAVWNGGGIRINIEQGPIYLKDVWAVLPFRNTVVLVEVSGAVLLQILEHSVASLPDWSGQFLQMSGLKVKYNLDRPVGQRVVSVLVQCSRCSVPEYLPLKTSESYKILLNSFMTTGGDGYTMIPRNTVVNIGDLVSDVFGEYIEQFSPLMSGLEGRIEYVTDPPQPSPVPCGGNKILPMTSLMLFMLVFFFSLVTQT